MPNTKNQSLIANLLALQYAATTTPAGKEAKQTARNKTTQKTIQNFDYPTSGQGVPAP
jgi:hypothetical protein